MSTNTVSFPGEIRKIFIWGCGNSMSDLSNLSHFPDDKKFQFIRPETKTS